MNPKILFIMAAALALSAGSAPTQNRDIPMSAFEMRMDGNPYGALELLDSALLLYPDSARIWFEKGRCLDWIKQEGMDKFTDAWTVLTPNLRTIRKCFNAACRLDPGNARYYYWAAENDALLGMTAFYSPWKWPVLRLIFKRCVNDARKAVALAPENPEYRYKLVIFSRFGWLLGGNKRIARLHADLDKSNVEDLLPPGK